MPARRGLLFAAEIRRACSRMPGPLQVRPRTTSMSQRGFLDAPVERIAGPFPRTPAGMIFSRDYARLGDELRQKGQFEKAAESYRKAKKLESAARDVPARRQGGAGGRYLQGGRASPLQAARLLGDGRLSQGGHPAFPRGRGPCRKAPRRSSPEQEIGASGLRNSQALTSPQVSVRQVAGGVAADSASGRPPSR